MSATAEYLNGNRWFVHSAYEVLLERAPGQNRDAASIFEVDYWTGQLNRGAMTRTGVAQFFINTAEFRFVKADNA